VRILKKKKEEEKVKKMVEEKRKRRKGRGREDNKINEIILSHFHPCTLQKKHYFTEPYFLLKI
jgi:hypothetical protein